MFVITMLAPPDRRDLDPALVDGLRNAWGGGDAAWLSPGEAAEFPVERVPGDFAEAWRDCQSRQVDLVATPAANRRKKLLIADMDSTLIGQECIDELADEAGVGERVSAVTARVMNGEVDFEDALRERVALLRGLPEDAVAKVMAERISFVAGGRTLVATMRAHGAHTALVSGGFTGFAEPVTARLGFDEFRANALLSADGALTGEVGEPILGRNAKLLALREIAAARGLAPEDAITVGDGANDLDMLLAAGTGVAFRAKPSVAEQCGVRIEHGDLTALLFLQGYDRDRFA